MYGRARTNGVKKNGETWYTPWVFYPTNPSGIQFSGFTDNSESPSETTGGGTHVSSNGTYHSATPIDNAEIADNGSSSLRIGTTVGAVLGALAASVMLGWFLRWKQKKDGSGMTSNDEEVIIAHSNSRFVKDKLQKSTSLEVEPHIIERPLPTYDEATREEIERPW